VVVLVGVRRGVEQSIRSILNLAVVRLWSVVQRAETCVDMQLRIGSE